jgi:hypothetical protein
MELRDFLDVKEGLKVKLFGMDKSIKESKQNFYKAYEFEKGNFQVDRIVEEFTTIK